MAAALTKPSRPLPQRTGWVHNSDIPEQRLGIELAEDEDEEKTYSCVRRWGRHVIRYVTKPSMCSCRFSWQQEVVNDVVQLFGLKTHRVSRPETLFRTCGEGPG